MKATALKNGTGTVSNLLYVSLVFLGSGQTGDWISLVHLDFTGGLEKKWYFVTKTVLTYCEKKLF
jgi:hypothetical protein